MNTSDEWIEMRTGVHQRYINNTENTSGLATNVGAQLPINVNLEAIELDLIITATMSPDVYAPSAAAIVQGRLGAKNTIASDISTAYTGFIYAINITELISKSSHWRNAMVVGAGVLSKLIN